MVRSLKESDSGVENTDNGNRLHGNKKNKNKKDTYWSFPTKTYVKAIRSKVSFFNM